MLCPHEGLDQGTELYTALSQTAGLPLCSRLAVIANAALAGMNHLVTSNLHQANAAHES
jgi:hypothetical protein